MARKGARSASRWGAKGMGSVESKHYLHDDRLPEKRDFAKVYDDYLGRIIEGTANEEPDNVIQFKATVPSIA